MCEDMLGGSGSQDSALRQDVGAVTDIQCFPYVMVSDQQADAHISQVRDEFLDIANRYRVDSSKGFVQQHECRPQANGSGNFDPAPLATRKAVTIVASLVSDAKGLHEPDQAELQGRQAGSRAP